MRAFCTWSICVAASLMMASVSLGNGEPLLPPMTNGVPGDFAQRRAGVEVNASFRISVTNEGLYRIDYNTLIAAGVSPGDLVGSQIRMFCRTQEIALIVSSGAAPLTTNDYILFYGRAHAGAWSITNVYWMGFGGSGLRMESRSVAPLGGAGDVTSHWETIRMEDERIFRNLYRPADDSLDHWFVCALTTAGSSNFVVRTDNVVTTGTATFAATLHGITTFAANPDHQTRVTINSTVITNFQYDNMNTFTGACNFAQSLLTANATTVRMQQVDLPGVTNDTVYLEKFSVRYLRNMVVSNGTFLFDGRAGTNNYTIRNVATNTGLWLLDVSDISAPTQLTGFQVLTNGPSYIVRFGDTTSTALTYRFSSWHDISTVSTVEKVIFRQLADTNRQADYIVICPYEFRPHVYRLLGRRYLQGYKVAVAPISDIYNEFSYGITDAGAIKQFLGYAFHHWQNPPPKYVLLAGDGTHDPKDNLGIGYTGCAIPVYLGPSSFLWTALDGWYAAVNGSDRLPDVAMGRIPVVNNAQLSNIVTKIFYYESLPFLTNGWQRRALLAAAASQPGLPFKTASVQNVEIYLTNGWTKSLAYREDQPSLNATRTIVTNQLRSGVYLATYFGHGSVDGWASTGESAFFSTNDVPGMTNNILPIVTVYTCQNGSFQDPNRECLAEVLLEQTNRGAIAVTAPSALSVNLFAEQIANGFTKALVQDRLPRIGDVMNAGLLKLWSYNNNIETDELQFYEVFGDPLLKVNP